MSSEIKVKTILNAAFKPLNLDGCVIEYFLGLLSDQIDSGGGVDVKDTIGELVSSYDTSISSDEVDELCETITKHLLIEGVISDTTVKKIDDKDEKQGPVIREGDLCRALYKADGLWYAASVTGVLSEVGRGKYLVTFTDYGNSEEVTRDAIDVVSTSKLETPVKLEVEDLGHLTHKHTDPTQSTKRKKAIKYDFLDTEIIELSDDETYEHRDRGCEMCEREMPLTRHHLIPQMVHQRYKKKGYTTQTLNTCAMICRPCHSALHSLYDNKTLAESFNTVGKIMKDEQCLKFVKYISKQKIRTKRPM